MNNRKNGRQKTHPCSTWCEQQLYGFVENLRLRGEISENFRARFEPLRGLNWIPGNTVILKCPDHGRAWKLVIVRDAADPAP